MKRFVFRVEEACTAGRIVTTADTDITRQGGVGLTGHIIQPCAETRVLNGAALCIAGMHEVGAGFVRALVRIHGADDCELVHALGKAGQVFRDLDASDISIDR